MTIGLEGFRVRCKSCRIIMYETTESYNCHQPLSGDMLRLLPLYKDWPTYDGSLASKGTSRFLMFCSQCASYITPDGILEFADFPNKKVTEISEERSKMNWWNSQIEAISEAVDMIVLEPEPVREIPLDDSKAEELAVTPKEMMEELDKRARTSRKRKRK